MTSQGPGSSWSEKEKNLIFLRGEIFKLRSLTITKVKNGGREDLDGEERLEINCLQESRKKLTRDNCLGQQIVQKQTLD